MLSQATPYTHRNDFPLPQVRNTVQPTALQEVEPGLLVKFECNNPAGSRKVQAARYIVPAGLDSGDIVPGARTVIEKTGVISALD